MTTVSTATTSPEICERAPAEPLTAVFDRLPLTTMPAAQPGAEVGGAEAEQLAVGVDLVVLAGGVGLGRAEPLGEADEHDPGRRADGVEVVVRSRRPSGSPTDGSPLSMWPTISTPWSSRSNSSTATMPRSTATSEPGTTGAHRRRPSTTASDSSADDERAALRVAELA